MWRGMPLSARRAKSGPTASPPPTARATQATNTHRAWLAHHSPRRPVRFSRTRTSWRSRARRTVRSPHGHVDGDRHGHRFRHRREPVGEFGLGRVPGAGPHRDEPGDLGPGEPPAVRHRLVAYGHEPPAEAALHALAL